MTVVELFAGGGGASCGLAAAGFASVLGVEWDEAAVKVAQTAGHPTIRGDVRDLSLYDDHVGVDAVWSSFPCQAFSAAGKRKGAEDERNGWPWTVAVLDKVKPRWVMAENVPGLTMHSGEHCGEVKRCPGCYFHRVILEDLRARFGWVGWTISNASSWGTPQHRRREFIVAGPRPVRWPAPTHAEPAKCLGLFGTLKPWTTAGEALGLLGQITRLPPPSDRAGNAYLMGGGTNPHSPGQHQERTHRDLTGEPCTTLPAAQVGNAGPWVVDPKHPPVTEAAEDGPAPAIRGSAGGSSVPSINRGDAKVLERPAPALAAGSKESNSPNGRSIVSAAQATRERFLEATGRRRLTVTECRVLMGWPPEYDEHLATVTKTNGYRILGNGCVPRWVEVHARAVVEADR